MGRRIGTNLFHVFSDDGALYFAFVLMGSCFGPAIGFVGGALQLTVWVEGPGVNKNMLWLKDFRPRKFDMNALHN